MLLSLTHARCTATSLVLFICEMGPSFPSPALPPSPKSGCAFVRPSVPAVRNSPYLSLESRVTENSRACLRVGRTAGSVSCRVMGLRCSVPGVWGHSSAAARASHARQAQDSTLGTTENETRPKQLFYSPKSQSYLCIFYSESPSPSVPTVLPAHCCFRSSPTCSCCPSGLQVRGSGGFHQARI